ncbi:Stk1 family PASTA domain-containing Ser/Thr kinase [Amphibacillus sediminis]|uniref:Stk1 family PASTA domain-containing Ser/Thr kinase n=1 Tax=Amphibacillus sediminis TaxID=360185 RepID=UPI00082A5C24|nr:Stk1 family PASTA domain-containing Ser/Thr kinase [Amphibacillus sediminis]
MLEGRELSERYQVRRLIGGGGMANVYLGYDTILEREVAIKALRLEYANDEEFIRRFHREAQSATSLSHPNIVNIYDVDEEDDIYYMVMEYVDGMTLKRYIQQNGPISVEETIDIMQQISAAIEHAHENHIVHRDIKPQNIMINSEKQVKVADFGIALALSATSLTQTNSVLGSVHYLSPEQARGGVANKKSDIYSLGIVLFELLTGRLPFSGQSAVSIALKHLQSKTPSVREWNPDVPQSLENVVLRATAKDPFHRYDSVAAFEQDLTTSLNIDRLNEPAYVQPDEPGDETKAIPIITDKQLEHSDTDDTLVHTKQNTEPTRPAQPLNQNNEEGQSEKSVKGKKTNNKKKKKMSKKKKIVMWISVILFVLLTASLFALFILPNLFQPKDVDIPDLEGELFEDAEDLLRELGLEVEREDVHSEEIETDHVVRTDPSADSSVKVGSTVTVFVSLGPETEIFQDYVGQSYNQVARLLDELGYQKVERVDIHSDLPEGQIIGQREPEPDQEVVPAETVVIFEVSIGKRTVTLEDLAGMDQSSASQYLSENGLVPDQTEEYSSSVPKGDVIRQSPSAGTELKEGAVVKYTVSLGEEEKPPVNHSVTVTVPYTVQSSGDAENEQAQHQEVRIYVDDMNHNLSDLYETDMILEDTEFTIRLVIAPNSTATYKIERDDRVILQRTVAFEDVEGN